MVDTRRDFSLYQAPNAGVEADVKTILQRVVHLFDETEQLRFQSFCDIWKDMNFSLIFCGREYFRELYEFTENLLDTVKRRTLSPEPLPIRAAAVYLLYAVYFKQPLKPKIRVRLTQTEYLDLTAFVSECRSEDHWDLVYAWNKMVLDHAFLYCVHGTVMGLEVAMAHEENVLDRGEPYQTRENPLRSQEFQNIFQRVTKLNQKYDQIKDALDPTVSLTKGCNFPEELQRLVDRTYDPTSNVDEDLTNKDEEQDMTIGERRKKLRQEAFVQERLTAKQVKLNSIRYDLEEDDSEEEDVDDLQPTESQSMEETTAEGSTSPTNKLRRRQLRLPLKSPVTEDGSHTSRRSRGTCRGRGRGRGTYYSSSYREEVQEQVTVDLKELEKVWFKKNAAKVGKKKSTGKGTKTKELFDSEATTSTIVIQNHNDGVERNETERRNDLSGVAATIESLVQGYDRDFEGAAAESVAKESPKTSPAAPKSKKKKRK